MRDPPPSRSSSHPARFFRHFFDIECAWGNIRAPCDLP